MANPGDDTNPDGSKGNGMGDRPRKPPPPKSH